MGRGTKRVGIAGRYGPRYGATLRKRVKSILEQRYAPHMCPFCGVKGKVYRVSVGIWKCRKCGATWAGAAYVPRSGLSKYFPQIVVREE